MEWTKRGLTHLNGTTLEQYFGYECAICGAINPQAIFVGFVQSNHYDVGLVSCDN